MRLTTRYLALGIAGVLLAACGHKDKDAPLAFVPADTPYVLANLDVLDDSTRSAMLAQANAQLPAQVAQLKAAADNMTTKDADSARLLHAFVAELDGKTVEAFAQNAGLNIKGRSAIYGLGLAPVARFELTDDKAFDAFVTRMETAYGKKFDTATVDGQNYRKHVSTQSGTQVILAVVGKQAVAALLPADAPQPMLREALGLDRPAKNLQDDGRLEKLAKDKGYQPWAVGQFDLARALPLAASGKDPFFNAMHKAHAEAESSKTGEPVANQLQIPPSCEADATRIAARVPNVSFGYTKLDAKHQDIRMDVALAQDITKAFSGIKVELPGLGDAGTAPFDVSLALPMTQLRAFWEAQASAVAAQPFSCPAVVDLNEGFTKLGDLAQKAAIPPFGDLSGLRIALDSFEAGGEASMPKFSGRVMIGTANPDALLAMGSMVSPAMAQLKLTKDGKPVALPAELSAPLGGQPAWLAMGEKALAIAIGQGEDGKLSEMLKSPGGDAGRMARMRLDGPMYQAWVKAMGDKAEQYAAISASTDHDAADEDAAKDEAEVAKTKAAAVARSKAQFESMRAQAERVKQVSSEAHVEDSGLVISSQTELK
ncbi:hypothetical protein [Dyella tabacisoli]|uniref:DUF3352 domain-containing protein n=1 Tax=Dyella tabacisoli TaxID=2282381 RepID=A0A369USK5_9GAMM|nr:hypothetical protein [Dyella tabacisoli]RDD82698.1 hypothetical protein DVJ77_05605 [Dyella tabacisoli]